jgi:hypothetical protein
MTPESLWKLLDERPAASVANDDMAELLAGGETISETRTAIAGTIRTLSFGGRMVVQERDQQGQHYLRRFSSQDQAARFVKARLDAYERMWDG